MIPKKFIKTFVVLVLTLVTLLGIYKIRADQLDTALKFTPVITQTQADQSHDAGVAAIYKTLSNNKNAVKNIPNLDEVSEAIYRLHMAYGTEGITVPIILGVIETESNFKPRAIGYAPNHRPFSYGLMQLTPKTAEPFLDKLNIQHPTKYVLFNPVINIYVGVALLHSNIATAKRRHISKKNTLDYALGMYNMGENGFFTSIQNGHPGTTASRYIAKQHKNQKHWFGLTD